MKAIIRKDEAYNMPLIKTCTVYLAYYQTSRICTPYYSLDKLLSQLKNEGVTSVVLSFINVKTEIPIDQVTHIYPEYFI
jgi:hypothetical protein